jgi:hypothetical protein
MACRSFVIALFLVGALFAPRIAALQGCYQACTSDDDCSGQLACMSGVCNDDPGVGTHICTKAPPPPSGGAALKGCYQACTSNDDCSGQLACMSGVCNDDPGVGTHICTKAPPPPSGGTCQASGYITGPNISPSQCNTENMSECCQSGKKYAKYYCSPSVTSATKATLTLNGFGDGEDGGGASACPPYTYYKDTDAVVALSTGWYSNGSRCGKSIRINGNGKSTTAKVVDECDSRAGCDSDHAYQPPCQNNIVDASAAVWKALGVPESDWGNMSITWS